MVSDNCINNILECGETKCRFFSLGRSAIYASCLALGLKPGDEILSPAFDCIAALEPFKAVGCSIKFIKSDPRTFSLDVQDLRKNITKKTRLLHVINHFGFPQDWDNILSLGRETGIPVLEDNAYSLFSKLNGRSFGLFGDFSMVSFRKNLDVTDGALLRINNPKYGFDERGLEASFLYAWQYPRILKGLAKKVMPAEFIKYLGISGHPRFPLYSDPKKPGPLFLADDEFSRRFASDRLLPMSGYSMQRLSGFFGFEYREICENKRCCYDFLVQRLSRIKGIEVLWSKPPEGIVPHSVAILVNKDRDGCYRSLSRKYALLVWPSFTKEVAENLRDFPDVELLGRRLLLIPTGIKDIRKVGHAKYFEGLCEDLKKAIVE